ncbi:MAG: hypothetical protein LBC13_01990 [Clostridiales bacterium]|nr:hypothetical protein [Clostridiales bacterium]
MFAEYSFGFTPFTLRQNNRTVAVATTAFTAVKRAPAAGITKRLSGTVRYGVTAVKRAPAASITKKIERGS